MHKKYLNRIGKNLDYMKRAGYMHGWQAYNGIELDLKDLVRKSDLGVKRTKALQRTLKSKKIKVNGDVYIAK